jgi:hypothetical protein
VSSGTGQGLSYAHQDQGFDITLAGWDNDLAASGSRPKEARSVCSSLFSRDTLNVNDIIYLQSSIKMGS